jgi:predicted DNA-binding protein
VSIAGVEISIGGRTDRKAVVNGEDRQRETAIRLPAGERILDPSACLIEIGRPWIGKPGKHLLGVGGCQQVSIAPNHVRLLPYMCPTILDMRKTSVYLDDKQADRLAQLARAEGRPRSQIIREAIDKYQPPPGGDRNFALAGNFTRIDRDPRPISKIPEDELMRGFGE